MTLLPRHRLWRWALLVACCSSPQVAFAQSTPKVVPPELIHQPVPLLPEAATLGTQDMRVVMHLVVLPDGRVDDIRVIDSAGPILDDVATETLAGSAFTPAQREGKPISARIAYELRFFQAHPEDQSTRAADTDSSEPPSQLPAATPAAHPAPDAEKEVLVTGSRTPELAARAVVGSESIRRQEIEEMGAVTLEDVLAARPGLQMQRSFRGTSLWIRGLDPEYTLILVNGQRVPGRIDGAVDLSRYPVERIERVEIVRGPASALYGSDAIGGVVNIILRDIQEPLSADAEVRLASDNAYAGNGRVAAMPSEWVGFDASIGRNFTDAFRLEDSIGTSGSARRQDTLSAGLQLGKDKSHRATARLDSTKTRLEGVDEGAGGAVLDRTQLQEITAGNVAHRMGHGDFYLSSDVSFSLFRSQYRLDQRGADSLDKYEDSREHLGQVSSVVDYQWAENQRTTGGGELTLQRLSSPRLSDRGSRSAYSVFAQHRLDLGNKRAELSLVPGLRFDLDSQFGSQLSPKLSARWDALEWLTTRFSYGRGFRAPSFQEQLLRFENPSVGYVVLGNPELEAERSHGLDLSLELEPSEEFFFLVAAFRNDLSHMITAVTQGETVSGTIFSYDNLSSARTQGVTSQVVFSPGRWLSATAGYTFTDTHDDENDRAIEGQAPHLLYGRVRVEAPTLDAHLIARGSIKLKRPYFVPDADGESELIHGEPLSEVDLRLGKNFSPAFEVFAGVNNLLNAGDRFVALLPRQLYAGVRGSY